MSPQTAQTSDGTPSSTVILSRRIKVERLASTLAFVLGRRRARILAPARRSRLKRATRTAHRYERYGEQSKDAHQTTPTPLRRINDVDIDAVAEPADRTRERKRDNASAHKPLRIIMKAVVAWTDVPRLLDIVVNAAMHIRRSARPLRADVKAGLISNPDAYGRSGWYKLMKSTITNTTIQTSRLLT